MKIDSGVVRAIGGVLKASPISAILVTLILSLSALLWQRPELAKFFFDIFNTQTLPQFVMLAMLSTVSFMAASRIRALEYAAAEMRDENTAWKLEHDICRIEQSLMRTALFQIGLMAASSPQEKEGVKVIVQRLDKELELVPDKARLLAERREGGPVAGGRRRHDPRHSEDVTTEE